MHLIAKPSPQVATDLEIQSIMKKTASLAILISYGVMALLLAPTSQAASQDKTTNALEIDYQKFVLDNGLTLIVHEDHKAPIVAVNIWYHVGSKNEPKGKTGFAHLFEHLMFEGSEHYRGEFTVPFDEVGATEQNATTSSDRTNYFENVPINALDLALWMESDRMGHMLPAITQPLLDEQRGVVQNEKRQRMNQPYGAVFNLIGKNAYPKEHPYWWPVIGSMKDLEAASLDDVHQWFKDYYGAANATVTIAGDVDPQVVLQKVKDNFGEIPAGPPVRQRMEWISERLEPSRLVTFDRVPQTRIIKTWNVPKLGTAEVDYLGIAGGILSAGKSSRLQKRLVYEDKIATDVAAFTWERELGGLFIMWATVSPGADPADVERAMDEELARLTTKGPSRNEVARSQAEFRASFIRGIESVGGFGGKADILAQSQVFSGNPDAYQNSLDHIANATPKDIKKALKRWIHNGAFVLEVHPNPEGITHESPIDRARLAKVGPPPEVEFPKLERTTLDNGLEIIVVKRDAVPVVSFKLMIDAGYAADHGVTPGTSRLTIKTLNEGTQSRTGFEISEELALLGANLSTGADLDTSWVELSALRESMDEALDIFADVILRPTFKSESLEHQRTMQLSKIDSEKITPLQIGLRIFPGLLYGKEHAYGLPFTGSGTTESVNSIRKEDLRAFHETWFKPNASSLIVVGDTTASEIVPKLERLFRKWERAEVPVKNIGEVAHREKSTVYMIDRPGSVQSMLFASHIAPPKANDHEPAIEAMNHLLGGSFNSRINRNLREEKHWSYGARSVFIGARGQRPFLVYAPVQTDKTAESMAEIERELREIQTTRPPTAKEIEITKKKRTLSLPGKWETADAIADSIAEIVRFGFEDDFWNHYAEGLRALTDAQVFEAAKRTLKPNALVWMVIGDREVIEPKIRELGFGDIQFLSADGEPIP